MKRFMMGAALLISLSTGQAQAVPITLNATLSGWYDSTGSHVPANDNYFTGTNTFDLHSYFVFDLSTVSGTITGATLRLYNPSADNNIGDGYGGSPSTLTIYDVSTSTATLAAFQGTGATGQTGIFTDLGSGTAYGSQGVSSTDNGQFVSVTLNAAALGDLNAGIGNPFAFGGALPPSSGNYVFAFTGASAGVPTSVNELVLTTEASGPVVPEPATTTLLAFGAAGLIGARLRRRLKAAA